jgi:hypothetical protein
MFLRHTTLNICMYIHKYMYINNERMRGKKKRERESERKEGRRERARQKERQST